jgi:hypothetical protein
VTSIWEENWHKGETFLLEGNRKYKKTSKKQNKLRGRWIPEEFFYLTHISTKREPERTKKWSHFCSQNNTSNSISKKSEVFFIYLYFMGNKHMGRKLAQRRNFPLGRK